MKLLKWWCPNDGIGVNRPAIVREIPHFGLFRNYKNCNNVSCTETFCSKKLCENACDSVT